MLFSQCTILVLAPVPDNLPLPGTTFAALPDHALVSLVGADASTFAQAQFANDVSAIADGHWHWNTWLTPKGRVIAVFALVKLAADDLLLIVPDYRVQRLCAELSRFVFRRKVLITHRVDLQAGAALQSPFAARGAEICHAENAIELDYSGEGGLRALCIASDLPLASDDIVAEWRSLDLRHGLARLAAEQSEQWTPQQLSLDRLHAYSVRKGCYPGQEIVARTHFLGKTKRELALFQSAIALEQGAQVSAGDRVVGSVVSTSGCLSLAVLPVERGPEPLDAGGLALTELPLLPGLARGAL